jgi:peroxiredoxin
MFPLIHPIENRSAPITRRGHLARISKLGLAGALAPTAALLGCSQRLAPEVTYVLLDATKLSTATLKGKVVLVNFWATSCVSCVAEMPDMAKLHTDLAPKGFDTLAVAMKYDPPSYVVNFAQTRQLPFKVAIDNTGAVAAAWGDVKVTPTHFLLNKRGEIVKTMVGPPDFAALRVTVEKLLAEG